LPGNSEAVTRLIAIIAAFGIELFRHHEMDALHVVADLDQQAKRAVADFTSRWRMWLAGGAA